MNSVAAVIGQFSGPVVDFGWIADNWQAIVDRTIQHLVLTGLAVGIGFAISLPLALVAARFRFANAPITWTTATLFTIPSLALFAIFVPITGLSLVTAEIGLVAYTLLILVENIVAGIRGAPPAVLEAATGLGYQKRQQVLAVQLPLALPAIVAGLRIATVTTVGLVTVTAVIGYGGLGYFILQGLQVLQYNQIVVGSVLSIALAVVLDALLLGVERMLAPWNHPGGGRKRRRNRSRTPVAHTTVDGEER